MTTQNVAHSPGLVDPLWLGCVVIIQYYTQQSLT